MIGGEMVSMLVSSVDNYGFVPGSGQVKDYNNGICCFSVQHVALRSNRKYGLALNQDNEPEWSNMPPHGLLVKKTS